MPKPDAMGVKVSWDHVANYFTIMYSFDIFGGRRDKL